MLALQVLQRRAVTIGLEVTWQMVFTFWLGIKQILLL
jgi:hypothetical protein